MPITSPCSFIAAYLNHDCCEIFQTGEKQFTAYVPTREKSECSLVISDVETYTAATLVIQSMGLQVTWN